MFYSSIPSKVRVFYNWTTEKSHFDNTETLTDYIENHMEPEFSLLWQDGNYAEVRDNSTFQVCGITAYGAGDSNNHEIVIEYYESTRSNR